MARKPVVNGSNPQIPLTVLIDTNGQFKGFSIQNVSGVDFYVSDDPTTLQTVNPTTGLPTVGIHFPPDTPGITPFIWSRDRYKGKLYGRAQNPGAQAEVIENDAC